jgi:glutaminase
MGTLAVTPRMCGGSVYTPVLQTSGSPVAASTFPSSVLSSGFTTFCLLYSCPLSLLS